MLARGIAVTLLLALTTAPASAAIDDIVGNIPQDLAITTTELGRLTTGLEIHISPDNSRLAYPMRAGPLNAADRDSFDAKDYSGLEPIRMVVDGQPSIASAEISTAFFSPDSKHVGYSMTAADKWHVIEDDKILIPDAQQIPGFGGHGTPIVFSPDSKHVGTIVQKNSRWFVAVDGVPWPIPGGINLPECGFMSFSPDSQHVLIMGKARPDSMMIFQDGIQLPAPIETNPPPGRPPRQLEHIGPYYAWAPDSSCIAYYGNFLEKRWQVFTTERVPFSSPLYDGILPQSLLFSGDSKRLVYVAKQKGKWLAVVDELPCKTLFDEALVPTIAFLAPAAEHSPEQLLYIARTGKTWKLYIDHQPTGDPFDGLVPSSFVISPDRKHFAFAVARGNQAILIRDGKPVGTYESIGAGTLAFSPDSQHLAWGIRNKMRWHACVDGKVGTADFAGLAVSPLSFSPDSRKVAYQAQLNPGMMRLYVGINADYQSKFFETFLGGSGITWRDNANMVTIAVTKMTAYRVEARIP